MSQHVCYRALAQCLKLVATSTTENRIPTTSKFESEAVDFLDQLKHDPKVLNYLNYISDDNECLIAETLAK